MIFLSVASMIFIAMAAVFGIPTFAGVVVLIEDFQHPQPISWVRVPIVSVITLIMFGGVVACLWAVVASLYVNSLHDRLDIEPSLHRVVFRKMSLRRFFGKHRIVTAKDSPRVVLKQDWDWDWENNDQVSFWRVQFQIAAEPIISLGVGGSEEEAAELARQIALVLNVSIEQILVEKFENIRCSQCDLDFQQGRCPKCGRHVLF